MVGILTYRGDAVLAAFQKCRRKARGNPTSSDSAQLSRTSTGTSELGAGLLVNGPDDFVTPAPNNRLSSVLGNTGSNTSSASTTNVGAPGAPARSTGSPPRSPQHRSPTLMNSRAGIITSEFTAGNFEDEPILFFGTRKPPAFVRPRSRASSQVRVLFGGSDTDADDETESTLQARSLPDATNGSWLRSDQVWASR